jgi:chemotaxis protein CheD
MSAIATPAAGSKTNVGMGQIVVGRAGDVLEAILGSCVGVVLIHPRQKIAALAHVVLPASNGRAAAPGKFADTAIPEMLRLLAVEGVPHAGLIAKIAGGANMFGNSSGAMQIGEGNIAAITEKLASENIRLVAKHVAGAKGRRISVDCESGLVQVDIVGTPKTVL